MLEEEEPVALNLKECLIQKETPQGSSGVTVLVIVQKMGECSKTLCIVKWVW